VFGEHVAAQASDRESIAARTTLLLTHADQGSCDLVAHTGDHGFAYADGTFVRDDGVRFSVERFQQRVISDGAVTFTAVPPREGRRAGIDRDEDGRLDQLDRH
jgi:hypothetical protein